MRRRLLDIFSGTGSVADVAESMGYSVRTLDLDERRDVDYCVDILCFEYERVLADWVPDVIWASPPCTQYSIAKTTGRRDLRLANRIVRAVLDIIEWAHARNPRLLWIVENPQTGFLKDQRMMKHLPYHDADYCQYGFPYRKRTRFWTNHQRLRLRTCPGEGVCGQMVGPRHRRSCGAGGGDSVYGTSMRLDEKYRVPEQLVRRLIAA